MSLTRQEYYNLLNGIGWEPASFEKISKSLMNNGVKQMYHALVHEDDINLLFNIPNLEIFWGCRCHIVGEDGSTAHEHFHALVQYRKGTHVAFKKKLQRAKKQQFHSNTTFKKILCPDHAVGVLRYITCRDGQRATRRDGDGLMGSPHTHYRRSVFGRHLLHRRNVKQILGCKDIRVAIMTQIRKHLSKEWETKYVSGHYLYLHHHKTCLCDFGKIGKAKKKAANEKRREFYKTERGEMVKNRYKEIAKTRDTLIETLMAHKPGTNLAEMEKETILKLLRRMK